MTELAAIGNRLRAAGLSPRGLAAWLGTDRLAALQARLDATPPSTAPAAATLELFVRGATVPEDRLAGLIASPTSCGARSNAERCGDSIDDLVAAGLVERVPGGVRGRVAVLPVGPSLAVCDRDDAPIEPALVCWPDDSSHHLASALPAGRRARWLDLGCGSAIAPLARPGLGARIAGVDRNPRAVTYARLGAALSGIAHLEVTEGDVGAAGEPAELVTCNAPIPDALEVTLWRGTDAGFFARLFASVPARLVTDPASLAVLHAARDAIPGDLPGERVIVTYTPPGPRAFAVLWWRPHAPANLVTADRVLSVDRPHLEPRDRDDALAETRSP